MAEETSRSDASTRWMETTRGILRYTELAPLLAERVLRERLRLFRRPRRRASSAARGTGVARAASHRSRGLR